MLESNPTGNRDTSMHRNAGGRADRPISPLSLSLSHITNIPAFSTPPNPRSYSPSLICRVSVNFKSGCVLIQPLIWKTRKTVFFPLFSPIKLASLLLQFAFSQHHLTTEMVSFVVLGKLRGLFSPVECVQQRATFSVHPVTTSPFSSIYPPL